MRWFKVRLLSQIWLFCTLTRISHDILLLLTDFNLKKPYLDLPSLIIILVSISVNLSIVNNVWLWNNVLVLGRWIAAQSIFYHLYNQVSYMSLDEISPLTFSIGNTMKRISVIVSSIIIFHTPVQPVNALGAAIAILGTFLYSQVIFSCVDSFEIWDIIL